VGTSIDNIFCKFLKVYTVKFFFCDFLITKNHRLYYRHIHFIQILTKKIRQIRQKKNLLQGEI